MHPFSTLKFCTESRSTIRKQVLTNAKPREEVLQSKLPQRIAECARKQCGLSNHITGYDQPGNIDLKIISFS